MNVSWFRLREMPSNLAVRSHELFGHRSANVHEPALFLVIEIMWSHHPDAEGAAQRFALEAWHRERTLHLGGACAFLGDAAEVGLQVAQFHWCASLGGGAGNALADGNALND